MTVKWFIDSYLGAEFNPLEKKKKNHVSIKWRMNNGS